MHVCISSGLSFHAMSHVVLVFKFCIYTNSLERSACESRYMFMHDIYVIVARVAPVAMDTAASRLARFQWRDLRLTRCEPAS